MGVPELMGREPTPDTCCGCGPVQLRANPRWTAAAATGGTVQDAEERSDRQGLAQLDPGLQLLPRPAVHPDLAAFAAFALAHEDRTASWVKVRFGKCERLADSQAGAPQHDDERTESDSVEGFPGIRQHQDAEPNAGMSTVPMHSHQERNARRRPDLGRFRQSEQPRWRLPVIASVPDADDPRLELRRRVVCHSRLLRGAYRHRLVAAGRSDPGRWRSTKVWQR